MPRILFLVSSTHTLTLPDGSPHPCGYWPEEVIKPYDLFLEAGAEVVVATPAGIKPTPDPYGYEPFFHYSDEDEDFFSGIVRTFMPDPEDIRVTLYHLSELNLMCARRVFEAYKATGVEPIEARSVVAAAAAEAWRNNRDFIELLKEKNVVAPLSAEDLDAIEAALWKQCREDSDLVAHRLATIPDFQEPVDLRALTDDEIEAFDAIFIPGGQAPLGDMIDNADVGRALRILHAKSTPIAAMCHGPSALLSAGARDDGNWLFDGFRLTSFTNDEELQTRPTKQPPIYMETELRNAGAIFDDAPIAWTSHVVVDRNLITGQNPMSSETVALTLLKKLEIL